MEQIVFPIPEICEYLTKETQTRVHTTVERDEQGSKVQGFFDQCDYLFDEMKWQKKLRGERCLLFSSSRLISLASLLFIDCVFSNNLPSDSKLITITT